eukprot:4378682-Pyramimonas_sp.AAC.1
MIAITSAGATPPATLHTRPWRHACPVPFLPRDPATCATLHFAPAHVRTTSCRARSDIHVLCKRSLTLRRECASLALSCKRP